MFKNFEENHEIVQVLKVRISIEAKNALTN